MQSLVGIVRNRPELEEALEKLDDPKERTAKVSVGGSGFSPGWNLATDLPAMLTVSTATAQGALHHKESRGGHGRSARSSSESSPIPDCRGSSGASYPIFPAQGGLLLSGRDCSANQFLWLTAEL
jgi:aspartate oxidase